MGRGIVLKVYLLRDKSSRLAIAHHIIHFYITKVRATPTDQILNDNMRK